MKFENKYIRTDKLEEQSAAILLDNMLKDFNIQSLQTSINLLTEEINKLKGGTR